MGWGEIQAVSYFCDAELCFKINVVIVEVQLEALLGLPLACLLVGQVVDWERNNTNITRLLSLPSA